MTREHSTDEGNPMMSHRPTVRLSGIAVALAFTVVLAGCSTTMPEPQVATIPPTESGAAASPSTASSQTRGGEPLRERLDMSVDELEALWQPFNECMESHGSAAKGASPGADHDQALAACQQFVPLPPWERDRSNPDARTFVQAVVDCLHGKGIKYVEIADDPTSPRINIAFGGPNNDSDSITRGMALMPECQREVSNAK